MAAKFNYRQIQGVPGNPHVTPEFIEAVEDMAERLGTKPEYLLAAMSFETGGSFDPSIQNRIKATGLIQFLKSTAINLGTTVDRLARMSAVAQLVFVEKYFNPFAGRLGTLEAVYTAILSGTPKRPDTILFKVGTPEYKLNPLDWDNDGNITAREATAIVAARMFGGVKAVQQRLLEIRVVPAAIKDGFVDDKWGANTSQVLAAFQRRNNLEQTGLMDEATGEALFSNSPAEPTDFLLEIGDNSEAVGLVQDALIKLGYLTLDQVGNFRRTFGPKTEGALKTLQQHLNLPETGKFSDVEQKAIEDILKGIGQGHSNTLIVKVIQDRLVASRVMLQQQVDTGYGTFGGQTETAVKKFQADNKLPASGIVEAVTFKTLFNGVTSNKPNASGVFTARDGEHYRVETEILMTERLQVKVAEVADRYFRITGSGLIITSGYRPPDRQARAMYGNITREGEIKIRRLYKHKAAIDEILRVYRNHQGNPPVAIAKMQALIEDQIKRGMFISNHLLSNAVDVRKRTTTLASLRTAAAQAGGRVLIESDHYHLELP